MQLFIIGRSGRGKDTLANYLADEKGMKVLKSYKVGKPKYEGDDAHIFITEEDLKNYPEEDMVASTILNDTMYFATKKQYDESDIYIIDPHGFYELIQKEPSDNYVMVYVYADPDVAKTHALERGDKEEDYNKRVEKEDADFAEFEKQLDNDEVENIVIFKYKNDYNMAHFTKFAEQVYNYLQNSIKE